MTFTSIIPTLNTPYYCRDKTYPAYIETATTDNTTTISTVAPDVEPPVISYNVTYVPIDVPDTQPQTVNIPAAQSGTVTEIVVTGLTAGQAYEVTVIGIYGDETASPKSLPAYVTTPAPP